MTRLEGKYSTFQEPLYQEVVQPKSTETTPCMVLPMGNAVFPVALEGLMVEHQSYVPISMWEHQTRVYRRCKVE